MKYSIPEILQKVSNARSREDKIKIIRENQSVVLEQVLQYAYHPDLKFSLPPGVPPYKKDTDLPIGTAPTNLYQEGRRLYIFLDGQQPNLKPFRKEQLFIELLEGIHWTEAEVMIAVKEKNLETLYPGLSYDVVYESIQFLVPPPSAQTVKAKPVEVVVEVQKDKAEVTESENPLVSSENRKRPGRAKGSKNAKPYPKEAAAEKRRLNMLAKQ